MVSNAAKLGVNVFPTIVYADFENAIQKAVTTLWPGLEVKVCRLHYDRIGGGKYNFWDSASSMERKALR
jgi:hypothetical protein